MKYINQLEYQDISYLTNLSNLDSDFATAGTVSNAGCGICCLCMMVNNLTEATLPIQDCIDYAYERRANMLPGTDMALLAPYVAEQHDLTYRSTNDIDEVLASVQEGSYVIANTRGDHGEHKGLFSRGGHFVLVVGVQDGLLTVLDPSYRDGKYDHCQQEGTLLIDQHRVYCDHRLLDIDCIGKDPSYYIFSRKTNDLWKTA